MDETPRTAVLGRGRSLLVHQVPGRLAGFLLRLTGRATPLPEALSPLPGPGRKVSALLLFLQVLREEEPASQAGSG